MDKFHGILIWVFGSFFILGGAGALLSSSLLVSVFYFGIGALLLPPIRRIAHKKTGKSLSTKARCISIVTLFLLSGFFVSVNTPNKAQDDNTDKAQNTQTSKTILSRNLPFVGMASADTLAPGWYFVTASVLNERLSPHANAAIANKLYRQQRLEVFEVQHGWARVSKYYDGNVEGRKGRVARWVSAKYLSKRRPADLPQPELPNDPRIQGIPKVGEGGLTEHDVRILYRGAAYYLQTGQCISIEYGDKSVSKPDTYYINCGSPRSLFFTSSDIP